MLHSCTGGRLGKMLGWGGAGPPGRSGTSGCHPPSAWLILGVYVHLSVGMIMTWKSSGLASGLSQSHLSNLIHTTERNRGCGVWVIHGFTTVELLCHPFPCSVPVSVCDGMAQVLGAAMFSSWPRNNSCISLNASEHGIVPEREGKTAPTACYSRAGSRPSLQDGS